MVCGQRKVDQRARKLIFNLAPTILSRAYTWPKAFFQHIYSQRTVPRVSSQWFSNGGLVPGSDRGEEGRQGRKMGGESREDLEQTPPHTTAQTAATPLWEDTGDRALRVWSLGEGGREVTGLSHTQLPPPVRMLHDAPSTEKRRDMKQLAGLVTHGRGKAPCPAAGLPRLRPLGSR